MAVVPGVEATSGTVKFYPCLGIAAVRLDYLNWNSPTLTRVTHRMACFFPMLQMIDGAALDWFTAAQGSSCAAYR